MDWISVKDRLPNTNQQVLTIDMDSGIESFYPQHVKLFWPSKEYTFTHWMPLPEPPKD